MKKNDRHEEFMHFKEKWWKIEMIMKLTFVMSFCIVLSSFANGFAQQKVNMQLGKTTVRRALNEFQRQTDHVVVYSEDQIKGDQKVVANFTDTNADDFLNEILKGTGLIFKMMSDYIVIVPEEKMQIPQAESHETFHGYVRDEKGNPLPGVTITLRGSSLGVATNRAGYFTWRLPVQDTLTLVFSFIGMETQYLHFKKLKEGQQREELRVVMREDLVSLEDVVVTGYANIKKSGFTGSSTHVTKADLLKVSPQNVMKALQAFDPSFKLIQNNAMGSDPNTMPEYYIRGRSGTSELKELDKLTSDDISQFALTNNPSAPIFILDGFEVDMAKVYDMDINRIENITILKDAVATAVYGSRAANGVIVIETSAPASGEIRVNYSGTTSITAPDLSSYNLLNAKEALEAEYYAGLFTGNSFERIAGGLVNYAHLYNNVTRGVDTDWIAKPLQTEFNHKHFLYIDSGNESLRWGLDMNYQHKGGTMKGSYRDILGAGMTVDFRWKSLRIKNQASFNIMSSENSPYGAFSDYVRMKPYLSPEDPETGNYYKIFSIYRAIRSSISLPVFITNPLYESTLDSFDKTRYKDFIDNLSVIWNINDYLMLKGTLGVSFRLQDEDKYVDPTSGTFSTTATEEKGSYADREIRSSKWNINALLSYNRQIKKHNLNFSLGVEASESKQEATYAYYRGYVEGALASPGNAMGLREKPTLKDSNTRRFGTFLQFNYTYNNIYLFDLSERMDGSSAFGSKKKMGTFWSVGTGINIHRYAFMQQVDFLNQFKLKVTYGQTGKANFNPYQARTTYTTLYDEPYLNTWGIRLKALGNENLKWEKVRTWNAGTEINLLNNALALDIDYYHATTLDQVEDVSIPSSSGFVSYKSNVGEVLNKGVEIKVNARVFQKQDWDIFLFANVNHNKNTITKIGEALQSYNQRIDEFFSRYSTLTNTDPIYGTPFTKYEVGNSLSAIYGMKSYGIDPANGNELYVKRDGTVTYVWSSAEQQCLGDSDPKVSGTCGLNARWKNFTLYTTFSYRWGGQTYNETLKSVENVNLAYYSGDRRILTDRWKQVGDITILKNIQDQNQVTRPTSRFVQDNSTLTFNSLSLGYNFDRDLVRNWGLSMLRLQLNMEDLATFSTIKQERGTSYPYARTFNFSLNITL